MDMNYKFLEKMIINDLTQFYKTWGTVCAIESEKRIKQFAYTEMLKYYSEYTPERYTRTNQMIWNSYKPFKEKVGRNYTGGIIINFLEPSTQHKIWGKDEKNNLDEKEGKNGKSFSEKDIYELVWEEGLHPLGYPVIQGHRVANFFGSGDNHYEIVKQKAYNAQKEINEFAIQKAMAQKYSIISF